MSEENKLLAALTSIEEMCPVDQNCRLLLECDRKNVIASLQAELEQFRWVPTSERRPEPYEFAIIKIPSLGVTDIAQIETVYDHYEYIGGKGRYRLADVTHWMPIPKLPGDKG